MQGVQYFFGGLKLLGKPGIRLYVLVPLLINVMVFSLLILWSAQQLNEWVAIVTGWLPGWLDFLGGLLWAVFAITVMFALAFGFNIVANLIAAPFNAFLAAAVQAHLSGEPAPDSGRSLFGEVIHGVARELQKLGYYLPRVLGMLLLSLVPFVSPFAPILWLVFAGWMMALQYIDYPMDNNSCSFAQVRDVVRKDRVTALGFGLTTLATALVPVVNFIVMPAAVAGATVYWFEESASDT